MNILKRILTLSSLIVLLGFPASASTILFFDDFSGGNVTLNETTPDTTIGTTKWVSAGSFKANGIHEGRSSAPLAFTPLDGFVYQAETWISASSGDFWASMGFCERSDHG